MMSADDPLAALVVDEEQIARGELAEVLRPHLRLSSSGKLLLEPEFDRLSAARKVACVLLAARAAALLGSRESAQVSPKELVEISGLPAGTVRPKLVELARSRLALSDHGKYEIPVHSIRRAAAFIGSDRG